VSNFIASEGEIGENCSSMKKETKRGKTEEKQRKREDGRERG